MEWLGRLYEAMGARYPILSYAFVFVVAGMIFCFLWWLAGIHYKSNLSHVPSAVPVSTPSGAAQGRPNETSAEGKATPRKERVVPRARQGDAESITSSAPQPLRGSAATQLTVVRGPLRQMEAQGHKEMWLSQVFYRMRGGLDGIPPSGIVDYPETLRTMAVDHEIEIIETARRDTSDIWGEVFHQDVHFEILELKTAQ